jgi:uncharacterized protein
MNLLLGGAGGLLGTRLRQRLEARGDRILRLVRGRARTAEEIAWEPLASLHERLPERLDGVLHLAGEPVFGLRWTRAKKERIRASRGPWTAALVEALLERRAAGAALPRLLSASAIGYYDPALAGVADEDSPADPRDFLSQVCLEWEAPLRRWQAAGGSSAVLRTGLVLAREGGVLARLLPAWRLGLGGRLGPAGLPWSWIHAADWVEAVLFLLERPGLCGPFNLCGPEPANQARVNAALAATLRRPGWLHLPAWLLRLLLGEMAGGLLLRGPAVRPARLLDAGFRFQHPVLEEALADLLLR